MLLSLLLKTAAAAVSQDGSALCGGCRCVWVLW